MASDGASQLPMRAVVLQLPYRLEFLPYHYLLVSIGEFGELV